MRISLIVQSFLLYGIIAVVTTNHSKIDSKLARVLNKNYKASVVISFKSGIQNTLTRVAKSQGSIRSRNRGPYIKSIIQSLEQNADSSQQGVLQNVLTPTRKDANGFRYFKRYPRSNLIYVKEASAEIVSAIAKDPQVAKIWEEPIIELIDATSDLPDSSVQKGSDKPKVEAANLVRIQLEDAWNELGGNKGEGVVVGIIDTGARHTHEALRDNFNGINYGWYDAMNNKSEPYENGRSNSHGTHVTGILIGKKGIGVAPGARWMTCVACNSSSCPYEALRDCFNWMECPTLPDGSEPDCSKAPKVINNSWASARNVDVFNEDILRWRTMGIIPIFAIGNRGPGCESTRSPGEQDFVIGVGGSGHVNDTDIWYEKSGIGPAPDGRIKPDLLAPAGATSATRYEDNSYGTRVGTSMATPHVSGVVVLLLVRNPDLTYDEAYQLLIQNTDQGITIEEPQSWYCEDTKNLTVYPNNVAGYGRLNALKTLQAQTKALQATNKNQSSSETTATFFVMRTLSK